MGTGAYDDLTLVGLFVTLIIDRGLMFRPFLDSLRRHGVPVSLREYLGLLVAGRGGRDEPGRVLSLRAALSGQG